MQVYFDDENITLGSFPGVSIWIKERFEISKRKVKRLLTCLHSLQPGLEVIKLFFMLISAEHEI